jgi:hypothetical protein
MNFSEILTFVRQRIKKLPESPFPHTYIYIYIYIRWIMIEIALNDVIPARYIEVCFAIFVTTTPIRFS